MKVKEDLPSKENMMAAIKEFNKHDHSHKIMSYNVTTGELLVTNATTNSEPNYLEWGEGWIKLFNKESMRYNLNMASLECFLEQQIALYYNAYN